MTAHVDGHGHPGPAEAPVRPPGLEPLASVWASGMRHPLQLTALVLIRGYQRSISLALGPVCRFYPSCSRYGFEAIRVHGITKGSWLTLRRLGRCNPWNAGGVDLVPARGPRRGATMDPVAAAIGARTGDVAVPRSTTGTGTPAAHTASRGARP